MNPGVLWIGPASIPDSAETVNLLQQLGKSVYFITNNSTRTHAAIADKALRLNFDVKPNQIITSATATAAYLTKINFTKKVYALGRPGIVAELEKVNIRCTDADDDEPADTYYQNVTLDSLNLDPDVGAVLVNYDHTFTYGKLLKAVNYLRDPECLFLATSLDERVPTQDGIVVPAMMPIARAIEACIHRRATEIGKPNEAICDPIFVENQCIRARTLFVGDSAKTDMVLGKRCGCLTLLVGTGIQTYEDVERWMKSDSHDDKLYIPDYFLPKLGDILPFLQSINE